MPANRPEALLHTAWRKAGGGDALVHSRDGEAYRVIYAGRPSDGAGPDFRDAVLQATSGTLLKGDIEIHVRASSWRQHGHQHDRRYNGVIFHVVSEGDSAAISAGGLRIPLVLLGRPSAHGSANRSATKFGLGEAASLDQPESERAPDNSHCARSVADLLPEASLGEAGDRRFLAKSSGFQIALGATSADDVMWAAVLEGLGYARNQKGFRQLAARMPWTALAGTCAGRSLSPADLELVLLRAAGLAGSLPRDSVPGAVDAALGPLRGVRPEWVRASGRPQNHPGRRIAAAAHLAHRWLSAGGPVRVLESVALASRRPRELDLALVVPGSGSGSDHSCLGLGRAGTIVVNAVLPCLHAIAFDAGRWHVVEKCFALYRSHSRLPENGVERAARSLLARAGRPSVAGSARDQQGLLYMYRALAIG